MIVTKKSLPRRTFLRGMGVTVALPFLDAMVPALSALAETPARPVRRLGFIYIPNGTIQSMWRPPPTAAASKCSRTLSPPAPIGDQLVDPSGQAHFRANA